MPEESTFKSWAILELMGHRRLAGMVSEQTIGGAAFIRIDVPGPDGKMTATQFYSPQAVYCITPTTEEIARVTAVQSQPEPVTRWELLQLKAPAGVTKYGFHCGDCGVGVAAINEQGDPPPGWGLSAPKEGDESELRHWLCPSCLTERAEGALRD